ncbi:response regulator [Pleionea sp. CnH1-48]|nr:response regulator [Pleionea sp. CnH1-48]
MLIGSSALASSIEFSRLTTKDGLSSDNFQTSKRVILQDRDGFLWFGSQNGLNRYDGYQFKTYYHDPSDANSISSSYIQALWQDSEGIIWIGTIQGLNRFDPQTEQFSLIELQDSTGDNELSINSVTGDNKNTLWVGATGGLIEFNTQTGESIQHAHDPLNSFSMSDNGVDIILVTQAGVTWMGTEEGLNRYNPLTQSYYRYLYGPEFSEPAKNINGLRIASILESIDGRIWVGTHKGLYLYNNEEDIFEPYLLASDNSPANHELHISSIVQDDQGQIWLGTKQQGLCLLQMKTRSCQLFRHDANNHTTISDDKVSDIYKDHHNRIWIASYSGLNYFYPYQPFASNSKLSVENEYANKPVSALMFDDEDSLWVGYYGQGLAKYNGEHQLEMAFKYDSSDSNSIGSDLIIKIAQTKDGTVWVGTHGKGLYRFNKTDKTFTHYAKSPPAVSSFIEDQYGNIWVGSTRRGLELFDRDTGEFTSVNEEFGNTVSIVSLYLDKSGRLWVATVKGIIQINVETRDYKTYQHDKSQPKSISHNFITSFYEDDHNTLWFTTYGGGLNRFNANDDSFTNYRKKDGLADNGTYSVIEDNQGAIWISTQNGLSKFNRELATFENFYAKDGLHSNDFNMAVAKSTSGELALGTVKGLLRFYPKSIEQQDVSEPLRFTDFKLFNNSISVGKKVEDSHFVLSQSILTSEKIQLTHKESLFALEFAAINSTKPQKVQYAYKLEGWDDDWIYTDHRNRIATYTNIPHGEYELKIKATDENGYWRDDITSLELIILPPFWKTRTAYFIYAFLVLLLVYLVVTFRTRTLVKRSIELERSVRDRTLELAQEKETVQKLLSEKNEEFSNISHEFRTPLTLILGPVAQLLSIERSVEDTNRLNIIQRNGTRILRMVDQLLDMEAFKVNQSTRKSPQAIGKIIQVVAEAFTDLAQEKNIDFQIKHIDKVCFDFIPDAIEKITLNLISNAIKYTPEGGRISVSAQRLNNEQYQIIIEDTGIGIAEDKQEDVFKRFHRVLDKDSETVTGAGIGLSLVKRLVESHNGTISLTSEPGKGTCVIVLLPVVNEVMPSGVALHFNDEVMKMELTNLSKHSDLENQDVSIEDSMPLGLPTVLIIEDNTDMRLFIQQSLAEHYSCYTAKNGKEGYELAKEHIPDLIISDVMMPEMDGFETTQILRTTEETSHIPIVLLTARGDKQSRLQGWNEKADEYLTKPFDADELLIRLKNLLSIRDILKKRFGDTLFSSSLPEQSDSERESEKTLNNRENLFIEKLNAVVEKSYKDSEFKMVSAASDIAMSDRQLHRKLKAICDMTPTEYLRQYRLFKARALLEAGETASVVALKTGFSTHSYFSKCFKAQFNCSPTEFVKENKVSLA